MENFRKKDRSEKELNEKVGLNEIIKNRKKFLSLLIV